MAAALVAMHHRRVNGLWRSTSRVKYEDPFVCFLPYDDTRYQLELLRESGTVKADLFAGYANAVAASRGWREEFEARRAHGS